MKFAWVASILLLFAAPAGAGGLGVEVLAPSGEVDAADVRAAIAAELSVEIEDGTAFAPALGRLEIAVDQGTIRIAYHPAAGTVIERTLALPANADERVQIIAFVATNLVRDQAGEILESLQPPPAPVVVIPPPPPAQPPPQIKPKRWVPATLGFVPPASVDRVFGEQVVVGFGLHALVGSTDGSTYASISGIADIQHDFARGAQIAGIAAITYGRVDGAQIAGIGAVADDVGGVQIGGIGTVARGQVDGFQIAGIGTVARGNVDGAQIAGIATTALNVKGAQIAGIATTAKEVDGAQIAGITSIAKRVDGLQIAGIANITKRVEGLQIAGVANIASDMHGVQVGVVNLARRSRGVQVGVVNISEDGNDSIPIGLVNFSRNGRLAAESWVESSRLTAAALRHGTKYVHNVWGVSWSPDHDHVLVGGGLGVHLGMFDIDAMSWFTNAWEAESAILSQLRASIAIPLGQFEIFGGAAANVYVSDEMDESANFHPVVARRTTTDSGRNVVAWPTAFVGVRLDVR